MPVVPESATLLQSLSEAGEGSSQWRSIESAPRDGRDVLIGGHGDVLIAHWHEGLGGPGWLDDSGSSHHDYWNYVGLVKPTHWMPLPLPPQSTEEAGS